MSMNSFHSRGRRPSQPATNANVTARRPSGMVRADTLLVEQGLASSRTRARQAIERGRVQSEDGVVAKPAQMLCEGSRLSLAPDDDDRYVSRGGLKLAAALARCGLDVTDRVCLDVGQSTGGFTDCLLQAGAAKVVGVEVGHSQVHPRLRTHPGCVTLEGVNARTLDAATPGLDMPDGGFDLIVCDASFISLTLLLPRWPALLAPTGDVVALVKPQFELGPEALAKGGVVRDAERYPEVETRVRCAAEAAGLFVADWFDSPLIGGGVGQIAGNREFLTRMRHAKNERAEVRA